MKEDREDQELHVVVAKTPGRHLNTWTAGERQEEPLGSLRLQLQSPLRTTSQRRGFQGGPQEATHLCFSSSLSAVFFQELQTPQPAAWASVTGMIPL